MRSNSVLCAVQAPPPHPEILQRRRIMARVAVSSSLAGTVADLAFGQRRRDDGVMLAGVVASRVGAAHG